MDTLEQARNTIDDIDQEMAALFQRRMKAVEVIAEYKRAHHLPIMDQNREQSVITRGVNAMASEELRTYYAEFLRGLLDVSKHYQANLTDDTPSLLTGVITDVVLERGCLHRAHQLIDLNRRVLIVTDDGVPRQYAADLASQCARVSVVQLPQGESRKSFETLQSLLREMLAFEMTRGDCVVAVGGGMVGDIAGFAASIYMRGIDFYNIPTTLLAQVDSCVGGKTAIDFAGMKNMVGTFYLPKKVLADPDLLSTLPRRQLSAGLAEALKMSVTLDPEMFNVFEGSDPFSDLDTIIARSLRAKTDIVAADAKETGLRRVLNFGHTVGHALEMTHPELLHGECVALGMMPMCSDEVRDRLIPILKKLDLPNHCQLDVARVIDIIRHDKKRTGDHILAVEAEKIGAYTIRPFTLDELAGRLSCLMEGADSQ